MSDTMTLEQAIAEVKRGEPMDLLNTQTWAAYEVIIKATASGDLIPKSEAGGGDDPAAVQTPQPGEVPASSAPARVLKSDARLAAKAEVARLRRQIEAVCRAHMVSAERCVALEDRAEAAEAEVARLREALTAARQVVYQSSIDRTQPEEAEAALQMIDAALKGDTP